MCIRDSLKTREQVLRRRVALCGHLRRLWFSRYTATTTCHAALLHRRTGHRSIRAEDATVTGLGLEQPMAAFALVKPLTGINRHALSLGVPAIGAGQRRIQYHQTHFGPAASVDGYPAFRVAWVRVSTVVLASSKVTFA